jgi:hypothetical protein
MLPVSQDMEEGLFGYAAASPMHDAEKKEKEAHAP